ncbi:M48 family metallopeptidase [Phycicoccus avicenniae]
MGEAPTGGTTASSAGRVAAVALALVVVLAVLALFAGWVWLLVTDDGLTRIVWAVLGVLFFWRMVPRPARVDARAVELTRADAPRLHDLVDAVAEAVATRPPDRVLADTTYPVAVRAHGYRGGATLVVGLPQWTALDPAERVAVLAHELRCAHVDRGAAGTVVRLAQDLLISARTLFTPTRTVTADTKAVDQSLSSVAVLGLTHELAGNQAQREASASAGAAGLSVVGAPFRWTQSLLTRLWRPTLHAAALEADRRAVSLAGPVATRGWLLSTVGVARGMTAAGNAARTPGADPFAAMEAAGRPDAAELQRRLAAEPDASDDPRHPPTSQRLHAVEHAEPVASDWVDRSPLAGADGEVFRVRTALTQQFREELVHGRS